MGGKLGDRRGVVVTEAHADGRGMATECRLGAGCGSPGRRRGEGESLALRGRSGRGLCSQLRDDGGPFCQSRGLWLGARRRGGGDGGGVSIVGHLGGGGGGGGGRRVFGRGAWGVNIPHCNGSIMAAAREGAALKALCRFKVVVAMVVEFEVGVGGWKSAVDLRTVREGGKGADGTGCYGDGCLSCGRRVN